MGATLAGKKRSRKRTDDAIGDVTSPRLVELRRLLSIELARPKKDAVEIAKLKAKIQLSTRKDGDGLPHSAAENTTGDVSAVLHRPEVLALRALANEWEKRDRNVSRTLMALAIGVVTQDEILATLGKAAKTYLKSAGGRVPGSGKVGKPIETILPTLLHVAPDGNVTCGVPPGVYKHSSDSYLRFGDVETVAPVWARSLAGTVESRLRQGKDAADVVSWFLSQACLTPDTPARYAPYLPPLEAVSEATKTKLKKRFASVMANDQRFAAATVKPGNRPTVDYQEMAVHIIHVGLIALGVPKMQAYDLLKAKIRK